MISFELASSGEDLIRGRARVGSAEIVVCSDGTCRFDGGAMFGVVPKTMWQKKMTPDEQNRVEVGLNCVLVKINGGTLLIETGFGNKLSPKLKQIYATQERLPQSLEAAHVSPQEVDLVLNTHLHWDHCGWNTVHSATGLPQPFFPNAKYIAHRGEVNHGRLQLERDGVSYVADNYESLIADGRMRLVEGDSSEIHPGIRVECFPGHTCHLMAVHIESEGDHACFVSDLIPTSAHLGYGIRFRSVPRRGRKKEVSPQGDRGELVGPLSA